MKHASWIIHCRTGTRGTSMPLQWIPVSRDHDLINCSVQRQHPRFNLQKLKKNITHSAAGDERWMPNTTNRLQMSFMVGSFAEDL